jgi:hypothetical protein
MFGSFTRIKTLCCYILSALSRSYGLLEQICIHLLVSNGKLSLCLLVHLTVLVQPLNGIIVQDLLGESHIAFSIFVTGIDLRIIRKTSQCLIQCFVHFCRIALEETPTASNEQSITCKHCAIYSILEEVADAVLGMSWRMQGGHFDILTDRKSGLVFWGVCDFRAVFAADYR